MLHGYAPCHPLLPSPGSRSAPKKFPKILPNRPDLSPAFRSVFQLRYGRRALSALPALRANLFRSLQNIQSLPSLPKIPKGKRQPNDATTSRTIACGQINDGKTASKNAKREICPGYRSVASASGSWSCRLLAPRRFPRFPISTREAARETSQLLLPQELATRQLAKTGLPKTQKGKRRLVLHALLGSCPQALSPSP